MILTFLFLIICAEKHPSFQWQKCTHSGCVTQNSFLVQDRHIEEFWHRDQEFDLDYENDIGVMVRGESFSQRLASYLNLKDEKYLIIGSRLYIMAADEKNYEKFNFVGKEFTFTVDLSEIPCFVVAAVNTVEMPADGFDATDQTQGAPYGYGYCDANCVDGGCCPEFDFIEAFSKGVNFTIHDCSNIGSGRGGYSGCDTSGCKYNAFSDDHNFWTTTVNLSQPVTIVTQFIGNGSTITSISRKYVQGGRLIDGGQLDADRCAGIQNFGSTLSKGHVVVFNFWAYDFWPWGPDYPPGCTRFNISEIIHQTPDLKVTYSDVKFGDIDTTY